MNKLLFLLTIILLCSCHLKTSYKPPLVELPTDWNKYSVSNKQNTKEEKKQWWSRFNDTILDSLIEESLEANSDILLAMTNVSKAQAQLTLNKTHRLPQIGLQGAMKQSRANATNKTVNSFSLAAVLNYEFDLWGAVARGNEAARASLLAANYNQDAIKLTVTSNVAIAYFNVLALEKELSITKELVAIQEEIYELNKKIFQSGAGDLMTLNKAQSALSVTQAELTSIEQSLMEQEKALAVLLARTPKEIVNGKLRKAKLIDGLPSTVIVPKILPSELLERRPDIRAAEAYLVAADAGVALAKAAYFPSISLTGLLGLDSTKLNKLFNNSAINSNFGSAIAGPLIDFGRTGANVKIAEETKKQYIIQYQQNVRTAFGEVMNYLSAQQTSHDNFEFSKRNERSLEEVMKITLQRYSHGVGTYLDVLNAKQILFQAKINKVNVKLKQLTASVNLFHALGGDW